MRRTFAILVFIVLFSCRKDDAATVFVLPAITQTGANTFGFLLDGKVWVNHGEVCSPSMGGCRPNLAGNYFMSDGGINIRADQVLYNDGVASNADINIDLFTSFDGPRIYSTATGDLIEVTYNPTDSELDYIVADVNPRFTINLTNLDTDIGIISGEFYGTLFRRTSSGSSTTSLTDSVRVTEGRFDLRYK